MKYRVIIEKVGEKYRVMLPDFPWLNIQLAASRNEALNLAKIALAMYLPTIEETTIDYP